MKQKIEERKRTLHKNKLLDSDADSINTKQVETLVINQDNNLEEKENEAEAINENIEAPKPKKQAKDKLTHEFKVLGINEFEKKPKVIYG